MKTGVLTDATRCAARVSPSTVYSRNYLTSYSLHVRCAEVLMLCLPIGAATGYPASYTGPGAAPGGYPAYGQQGYGQQPYGQYPPYGGQPGYGGYPPAAGVLFICIVDAAG